jgi:CubicO group peptidase (beta-lactamase class C family)
MNSPTRRDVSFATIALALLAAAGQAQAQQPASAGEAPLPDDQIRALLADRIDTRRQSVGMVIGVIGRQGRRIVSHGAFGLADKRPVAGDTLFGIASVSKAFTGLLLADAVRRKEVKLDDPAALRLPAGVRLPERKGRKITLIDLATHTSGLPHELPAELQTVALAKPAKEARSVMYDFLAGWTLPTDIGSTWSYSNLEYTLIGYALEARTGLSYEALLRTRILDPLGLSDTGISVSPAQWERRAHPHTEQLTPSPEWNKPWSVSVLQSTANDMLTFLATAMGLAKTPLSPAFDAMLAVRRPAPSLGRNAEQALGWYVYPFNGRPMIGHTGSGGGFAATVMYDPAAQIGVVLLSNAEVIQEDVCRHVLRPSLPLDVISVEVAVTSAVLDAYVGRYLDPTGATITVSREPAGLLMLLPQGYKVPLKPESETRFFVPGFAGMFVEFQRGADKRATGLTWSLSGVATSARKVAE